MELAFKGQSLLKLSHILVTEEMSFFLSFILLLLLLLLLFLGMKLERSFCIARVSLVAQWVKSLPAVQDSSVRSLALEDPLKKEMATHSSILAWRIPWTEEPVSLQSMGS